MKNTFKILTISLVFVAGLFGFEALASSPEDYPSASASLVSRVGSLVLSSSPTTTALSGAFFNPSVSALYANRCERTGNTATAAESCLDVNGSASFSDLFTYNLKAFVQNKTFVGPAAGIGPGAQSTALHVADTGSGQDSIMVSDLGRFNGSDQFEPKDKTTLRGVCADANGELFDCDIPTHLPSSCDLTFTDPDSNEIYPIVDAEGVCWFGKDLVRNQISLTNANYIYDFHQEATYGNLFFEQTGTSTSSFKLADNGGANTVFPYNAADGYHTIPTTFKTFIMSTCGWTPPGSNTTNGGWYEVAFPTSIKGTATGGNSSPNYDIRCIDDNGDEELHKFIYSINEPAHVEAMTAASTGEATPGPFFFPEDIGNTTCPAGWHVPTYSEWINLKDSITNSATAAGTVFHAAPLAIEMDINTTVSDQLVASGNSAWAQSGGKWDGSRYYSREVTTDSDVISDPYSSWFDNVQPGTQHVVLTTVLSKSWDLINTSGNLDFTPTYSQDSSWYKTTDRAVTHVIYYVLEETLPKKIFAKVKDIFFKDAYAVPPDTFGRNDYLGKVRCVQGEVNSGWSVGGWGSCVMVGGPAGSSSYQQSRTVQCKIGSETVHQANCTETMPNNSRPCVPGGLGGGLVGPATGGSGGGTTGTTSPAKGFSG